jgi:conjugative relaxase-like TrwC/TraI family protein
MVASISARGSAKAALEYYEHLRRDDYYTRNGESPGRWAGQGAERLSLRSPVTHPEFDAALTGRDPKTGEQLAQPGGRGREHAAGWDMTFSAPKSVSVLWALSEEHDRRAIEQAHRTAVLAATAHLERAAGWARRGRAGSVRERTAGLVMAQFDHHTSRDSDPQLHTHCFIFNLAPRRDGSWGAIVSRELYRAQKAAGRVYRRELGTELERLSYRDKLRAAAIPHDVERAFSKRRQAIEEAARAHGYKTAKGMELATLRTRRAKRDMRLEELFKTWEAEAKTMGFELNRDRQHARQPVASSSERPHLTLITRGVDISSPIQSVVHQRRAAAIQRSVVELGTRLGRVLRSPRSAVRHAWHQDQAARFGPRARMNARTWCVGAVSLKRSSELATILRHQESFRLNTGSTPATPCRDSALMRSLRGPSAAQTPGVSVTSSPSSLLGQRDIGSCISGCQHRRCIGCENLGQGRDV